MSDSQVWVLFGGAGFIGMHLAEHLVQTSPKATVVIADIVEPGIERYGDWYVRAVANGQLLHAQVDVRDQITHPLLATGAFVAVNLAAVHREPGHAPHEYYITNIRGAENIAEWAVRTKSQRVVFVSSISVYGNTRKGVDERSLPMPETPYGISKLVAEQVFLRWRAIDAQRRLAIVRPAVVFGSGEGGNMSRLVRTVVRGRFVFTGNRAVRKAAGYVSDLCAVINWLVLRMDLQEQECIANFALPEVSNLDDYVRVIQETHGRKRWIPDLPYRLVYALATMISALPILDNRSPIHPRRVEKLIWATDVRSRYLSDNNYIFGYTLEQAFADWKHQAPQEWR